METKSDPSPVFILSSKYKLLFYVILLISILLPIAINAVINFIKPENNINTFFEIAVAQAREE